MPLSSFFDKLGSSTACSHCSSLAALSAQQALFFCISSCVLAIACFRSLRSRMSSSSKRDCIQLQMGNACCEEQRNTNEVRGFVYNYAFQQDKPQTTTSILRHSQFGDRAPTSEFSHRQICARPVLNATVQEKMQGRTLMVETDPNLRGQADSNYYRFALSGNIYSGEWKDSLPHGVGTMYLQKGSVFQGMFREGVAFGKGKLIMTSGAVYEGDIKYGRANGEGVFTDEDYIYRGQFKDDLKDGQGEERDSRFTFKGLFQRGEKVRGIYKYEGNIYEGQFQSDEFDGKGELKNSDGSVYNGHFRQGRFHGYGEFKWKDGSLYRGHYTNGQRQGDGQFFNSKNSSISKGRWERGRLAGQGQYKDYKGQVTRCIWENGRMTPYSLK